MTSLRRMVTDGDHTYHGEHCTMYRITKSLCCTLETNSTLYVSSSSIKKKKELSFCTDIEIFRICSMRKARYRSVDMMYYLSMRKKKRNLTLYFFVCLYKIPLKDTKETTEVVTYRRKWWRGGEIERKGIRKRARLLMPTVSSWLTDNVTTLSIQHICKRNEGELSIILLA